MCPIKRSLALERKAEGTKDVEEYSLEDVCNILQNVLKLQQVTTRSLSDIATGQKRHDALLKKLQHIAAQDEKWKKSVDSRLALTEEEFDEVRAQFLVMTNPKEYLGGAVKLDIEE